MLVALYILIALAAVGIVLRLTDKGDATGKEPPADAAAECCGMHAVCERANEAAMAAETEYFDDEELDTFAGRNPDTYTNDEIEQFREVMLTLPAGEAVPWAKSLERRGITMPSALRDEFLIIVSDNTKP